MVECALERLGHSVRADQAGDDDGGGDAKPLAREIDHLSWLVALELLDLQRMAIEAACEGRKMRSRGADV